MRGHPSAGLDICDCCVRPQTLAHTQDMHTIAVPHITSPARNILSTPASPVAPPRPRLSPCPVRARARVRSTPAGQEPPRSSAARPRPSIDTPRGPAAHPHVVSPAAETHDAALPGVSLGPAGSVCGIRLHHPPPAGYTVKHETATVHEAPVEQEATNPSDCHPPWPWQQGWTTTRPTFTSDHLRTSWYSSKRACCHRSRPMSASHHSRPDTSKESSVAPRKRFP